MKHKFSGLSLIELLVALVILSLLAAVAYPAYSGFTQRSQRSAATTEIARVALLQENFYMGNRTYTTLSLLGYAANTIGISDKGTAVAAGTGVYNLTITPAPSATQYTVQATATGSQTSDTGCTTITRTSTGVESPEACW